MRPDSSRTNNTWLLVVLVTIYAFNGLDRWALGLLLQDIKLDLSLSDTQLGYLTGIAFFLFYSVAGLPLARWADHGNRVTLLAVCTALWSAAVALCGAAGSFLQLLLIRIGVAVGEAGCIPPANSLIADHFSRAERPRANARFALGAAFSAVIAFFAAGWLNELYGWRLTFVFLGLPGLLLAALAWLTLKEPRRSESKAPQIAATEPGSRLSLKEVCAALWRNVTFRHLLLAFSLQSFFGFGMAQWKPAFFIRSFGLQTAEVGTWFALIYGAGCLLGFYLGGELASRYARHNERLQLIGMAGAYVSFGVISMGIYLSPDPYLAFLLLWLSLLGWSLASGPLFATIQTLVPDRMRATAVAMIYLFSNLIGMGLGPLAAGVLSDAYQSWAGEQSLRYALVSLCPGYFWAGWHLWRASRTVSRDMVDVSHSFGTAG